MVAKKLSALVLFMLFSLLVFSCKENKEESKDTLENSVDVAGNYGDELKEFEILDGFALVQKVNELGEFQGQVQGVIKEVCTKKGCWMTMELAEGQEMRITFKDYGFFVPLNSKDYPVIIEGVATKKTVDVATLKHYAEDAGASAEEIQKISSPKEEYEFVASGVKILNRSE